jgi:hypothetical protein
MFLAPTKCSAPLSHDSKLKKNQLIWASKPIVTAKLLLALASTAILGSEFQGFRDHILLSDGCGSPQTTYHSTNLTHED